MEHDVEQHRVETNKFQDKIKDVLKENQRLLEQAISTYIVDIVVNANVNYACETVNDCERCVTLTELQRNFIKKECYDKLFKQYTTLEKHCISLEVDTQLEHEIFQRNNSFSQQSVPSFDQLFKINDLKALSQEKDTIIMKLKERIKSLSGNLKEEKIKKELEEIETKNIELDHRVTKLVTENEHLKQTYKKLYDSIKSSCVRSKEQCDALIKQVNTKSAENSDLNASLQEKDLVITTLKNTLSKLKGKAVVDEAVTLHPIDSELLRIDVAPLAPKLRNNRTAHYDYLKHTQEETATLRDIIENERLLNSLNTFLDYACKYTKRIQELLIILKQTCPCINDLGTKLMVVTPVNNNKKIRFTEHISSSGNTPIKTTSSSNVVSNKPMLSSTAIYTEDTRKYCKIIRVRNHTEVYQLFDDMRKVFDRNDLVQLWSLVKERFSSIDATNDKERVLWVELKRLFEPDDNDELWENDHVAKIMGYGDYKIGNVTISRVYFVEGLGHNLFSVDISHETSVARSPQQNDIVERRNHTLIEAARTIENLGKLQPKADIGIFISYAPTKKAFRIYNRRTRRIVETIHVDFAELTTMAFKQSSSGPALNEMTPATISSGLVPKPTSSTPYVPPLRNDWDLLFQLLFDELLTPSPSVDPLAPKVIALLANVIPPEQAESTGSPSSAIVDQDAPSPSKSQTTPKTQSSVIPQDVEEDIHDIEVAHMGIDPLFGMPIPKVASDQSSSMVSPHTIVHPDHQIPQHNSKWTKDHPLDNIIGQLSRPVSTRLQLNEQALFCYYDAFLTTVEPKTYKDALTQSCWIEAMQEELNEFERLKVWELLPRPNKVMVITLKWIYKVKLDELHGLLYDHAKACDYFASQPALCIFHKFATGAVPPKTKASVRKTKSSSDTIVTPLTAAAGTRLSTSAKGKQLDKASKAKSLIVLSEVAMTEAEQLKLAMKRSLQQTHISQASGSGADEGIEDDDDVDEGSDDQDDDDAQDDDDD
nr:hypothetical protein [Tanacetum cinerariifolium]